MKKIESDAIYFDIIYSLLDKPFNVTSLTKLIYLSLAIRHLKNTRIFSKRERNLLSEILRSLNGVFDKDVEDLNIILEILLKLEKSNIICIDDNKVTLLKFGKISSASNFINMNNSHKIIEDINKISDKAFMEEVLKYV